MSKNEENDKDFNRKKDEDNDETMIFDSDFSDELNKQNEEKLKKAKQYLGIDDEKDEDKDLDDTIIADDIDDTAEYNFKRNPEKLPKTVEDDEDDFSNESEKGKNLKHSADKKELKKIKKISKKQSKRKKSSKKNC